MIPRFGIVFPLIMSVIGMIDARYVWHKNTDLSIFLICLVAYLIYFMCKRHASIPPGKGLYHIVVPFLVMLAILVSTYLIFF